MNSKKPDKLFIKFKKKIEQNPQWWAWVEKKEGTAWIERVSKALERIRPSYEEMLMDIVEANLEVEFGFDGFEVLAEQKEEVIAALWKMLQITKWLGGEKMEVLDQLGEGE